MKRLRRWAFWVALHIPLGALNPHLFAFGCGAASYHKVDPSEPMPTKGETIWL